jgi:hypothetical protein
MREPLERQKEWFLNGYQLLFNFNTMISSNYYGLRAFDVASCQEERPLPAEGDQCNIQL